MTYILWGSAPSLYTGKARSYLIKKGLDWQERCPSAPEFARHIAPAVGHRAIPVLETPDGDIVQDSGDIIDWLEARHPDPQMEPDTPVQQIVSRLFDGYGAEFLLPLAMHYRWTYRSEQEAFLQAEFGRTVAAGVSRDIRRATAAKAMEFFAGFLPNLGVAAEAIPAMEQRYALLMDALDEHFQYHPYLLGGRPCRGDFGMMASLFAHLGRDPVPAALMKAKAPNLFRWTERMNLTPIADGEYPAYPEHYAADDAIPETLETVLQCVFADWTPGLRADADCFNAWAAGKPSGEIVSRTGGRQAHPNVGKITYDWHGTTIIRGSAPHALWMFAAALDRAAGLQDDARIRFEALLNRTGGTAAFALSLDRAMVRRDSILVLA